jgi:alkanesulfonate monooxygenase SsuD/methylene tetrahydromethanopterin reductase-like flavin-dependent oxidoreductase (luciferase family)
MEYGVNFFPVFDPRRKSAADYYRETIELAVRAERLGFEHVQTVEHYGRGYGGYSPDPVVLLTAIAARTTSIRITTGAVIPAFIHPVQLAGKLAMLDVLSGGRLDVGFGRGFLPDEFELFGVPIDSSRARFAEGVEACRRLWSETDVKFSGEFASFGPFTLLPRPIQQPTPPIFVASAMSTQSCADAGAAGYHLQLVPSVTSREQLAEMLAAHRQAWAGAGLAPQDARVQIKYTCYLDRDDSKALHNARRFEHNYVEQMARAVESWAGTRSTAYPGYGTFVAKVRNYDFDLSLADLKLLAGNPDQVRAQLATITEWFGDEVTLSLQFGPGYLDHSDSVRAMELFRDQVAPSP